MKRIHLLLLAVLATLALGTAPLGCSRLSNPEKEKSSIFKERERNCSTEYERIANRPYFYSVPSAISTCDSFLDYFQYKRCDYCDDVRAMRESFRQMGDFLGRTFYSYEHYRTESIYLTQTFANSPYPVVRGTWARLSCEEDSCRLRAALLNLTAYDFKVYLHDYAMQLCQERYGKGLFAMRVSHIELAHMTIPTPVEGTPAIECTAEYNVYLEGPLGLGLRTRTDRLTVTGRLSFSPEGRLQFQKLPYGE